MGRFNLNGIFVLIFLSLLLLLYASRQSMESFIGSPAPDYCGTAGIRQSDAYYHAMKKTNQLDLSTKRWYTQSECTKLDGGTYVADFYGAGKCYKLKDVHKKENPYASDNVERDYTETCASLNTSLTSPAPSECMVNGAYLGKASVSYSETKGKDTIAYEDNSFRLYTENECKLLKGEFELLEENMKGSTADEIAKAIQLNGKEYGFCTIPDAAISGAKSGSYSFMCTVNTPPVGAAKISTATKSALNDWLSS